MSHKAAKRKRYPDFSGGIKLEAFVATWNRMAKAQGHETYAINSGTAYTASAKELGYESGQAFLDAHLPPPHSTPPSAPAYSPDAQP